MKKLSPEITETEFNSTSRKAPVLCSRRWHKAMHNQDNIKTIFKNLRTKMKDDNN